jgi:SAM-dependent methyltransferase
VLTVDFARLPVGQGTRVLDLGCGAGRHAFEAARRGARVVALDTDLAELSSVSAMTAAIGEAGEIPAEGGAGAVAGDATAMPFPDGCFDVIIAAEVLEHIPADRAAIAEITRVLAPGGTLAVTVPAWLPERICWLLSDDYHNVPGGHIRIFTRRELETKLAAAGLAVGARHHAHALHSPYWWLKCAVGVHDDSHPLASTYHKLLVWDIMHAPRTTRTADRLLNPLIGKSLVLYATKPPASVGAGERPPAEGVSAEGISAAAESVSRAAQGAPAVPTETAGRRRPPPMEMPIATAGPAGPSDRQAQPQTIATISAEATRRMPPATAGVPARADGKGAPGGEAPRSGGPGVTPRDNP